MRFVIKEVGRGSYLHKVDSSSVSVRDVWFSPLLEDAIKYDFYFDAHLAIIFLHNQWDKQCVMVEVE
jgi:hypothetical protein